MDFRQYCRESCEMQNATTPEDFVGMGGAWVEALRIQVEHVGGPVKIGLLNIFVLGSYVDARNMAGFRSVPATFANGNFGASPQLIRRGIDQLLEHQKNTTPAIFYKRFEEIHPFVDGNGRVGSLLFNILNGTITDPIHPPKIDWG